MERRLWALVTKEKFMLKQKSMKGNFHFEFDKED